MDVEFLAVVRETEADLLVFFEIHVEDVAQVIIFRISNPDVFLWGIKSAQILVFGDQLVVDLSSEFAIGLAAVDFELTKDLFGEEDFTFGGVCTV